MKNLSYGLLLLSSIVLISCNGDGEKENEERKNKRCDYVVIDWPDEIARCITEEEKQGLRDGSKTLKEVWERMKRDCPNVTMWDNGAALAALIVYPDAILINSKADMMNKLKERAERDTCCISKLVIRGHGSDGNISVGDGQQNQECKYINGDPTDEVYYNADQWKAELAELKGLFCKEDAEIVLEGCWVGYGDIGRFKCEEIAKEFGVMVSAPLVKMNALDRIIDLPSDSVRRVQPPAQVRNPAPGEKEKSNRKHKEEKKKDGIGKGAKAFKKKVTAIGFYSSKATNVPDITTSPVLPITDPEWISTFVAQVDTTEAYDANLEGYKVDATLLVKYDDGTYQFAYTLYGNLMFGIQLDGLGDMQFSLSEKGTAMVQEAIGMSEGTKK